MYAQMNQTDAQGWHCKWSESSQFSSRIFTKPYLQMHITPPHSIFVGEFVDDLILGTGRFFSLEHAVQMVRGEG